MLELLIFLGIAYGIYWLSMAFIGIIVAMIIRSIHENAEAGRRRVDNLTRRLLQTAEAHGDTIPENEARARMQKAVQDQNRIGMLLSGTALTVFFFFAISTLIA